MYFFDAGIEAENSKVGFMIPRSIPIGRYLVRIKFITNFQALSIDGVHLGAISGGDSQAGLLNACQDGRFKSAVVVQSGRYGLHSSHA